MKNLNVAICQVDMEWEKTSYNLQRIEPMIAQTEADIVVLPEMFATGFKTKPSRVAQPHDGEVASTMLHWAQKYQKAIVGSVVIEEGNQYRNRMFFMTPEGQITWYDKHHLFRPGGEARDYTPGDKRVIVEYRGVRFLLLICYDLRFPVWSRNRGDYDAIICSASWADDKRDAWRILMRARAIENQCYMMAVNRVGKDPDGNYEGDSAMISFEGKTILDAGNQEKTLVAALDMEAQAAFREKFPAWMDADDFTLNVPH